MQGRLKGKRWIVGSATHACWLGSYELSIQQCIERSVERGRVFYDLGAHVSYFTLLASELVGSEGRVYAFEPVPRNLRYLKEHLRINFAANVQVIEAAVSDNDGEAHFEQTASSQMGYLKPDGDMRVATVCLNTLVANGTILPPAYIKMDVQGAEMCALRGAEQLLADHKPIIFLSTHGQSVHAQCCKLLRTLGYSLLPVHGKSVEDTDELLATTAIPGYMPLR